MFTRERALPLLLLLASVQLAADETPRLGEALDAAALQEIDFTILPNGDGLPPGQGNASSGVEVYQRHCIACHGPGGNDGVNDALAGGHGSLTTSQPRKTIGSYWPYATTIFDYVRRAMPYQSPGVLSNDEIYALTAYLLFINGVVTETEVLSAETLPLVKMPNRDGFIWAVTP